MCGLFGFIHYGNEKLKLTSLVEYLGQESTVRGTDATGIAYIDKSGMQIEKKPVSAYKFFDNSFTLPARVGVVMGHTRRTTQGNEKHNFNNHPFKGVCGGKVFALAHNGVLDNDTELRKELKLPATKIETDSYIAVQLIEHCKKFGLDAIKFMAEKVEGMYTFTILDNEENLWIVKNDSPFVVAHIPDIHLYVYASTEEILMKALMEWGTSREKIIKSFTDKQTQLELMFPKQGEIWKISPHDGSIEKFTFTPQERYTKWYSYKYITANANISTKGVTTVSKKKDVHKRWGVDKWYWDMLVGEAVKQGVFEKDIEAMLEYGFDFFDIEDAIYDGTLAELYDMYIEEIEYFGDDTLATVYKPQ